MPHESISPPNPTTGERPPNGSVGQEPDRGTAAGLIGVRVIRGGDLPGNARARLFEGALHGGVALSLFWVRAPFGHGPALHRHPYPEVFVVHAGQADFVVDGVGRRVGAGQLVVVPANTPHRFVSTGTPPLRLVAIHPSAQVQQTGPDG